MLLSLSRRCGGEPEGDRSHPVEGSPSQLSDPATTAALAPIWRRRGLSRENPSETSKPTWSMKPAFAGQRLWSPGGSNRASPLKPLRSSIFSTWKASRIHRWASWRRLILRSGSATWSAAAMHSFARVRYRSPVIPVIPYATHKT